ncbi:MAG: glycosyltransferase [Hyphomonadaceae bacterium]
MTRPQIVFLLSLAGISVWTAFEAPSLFWLSLYALAVFVFTLAIGVRLVAAAASLAPAEPSAARWPAPLPRYTLICPLFLEADVAHGLVAALKRLDYPSELLDVKLVLEEDDIETRAALAAMALPAHFEILVAPQGGPRTKPHALNHALSCARGDFVAIYDAEDRPHPAQLKAALDAFAADTQIACVQAPLAAENADQSWIAGQFAAEYAIQFRAMLPLLARLKLPLPLGGTSNHFRVETLRAAGAWDPWNVTEDADLGYRLAREGWRSAMIAPPTQEEAPITFDAWLKQRTRWIKGHMQTWLVLMRDPFATAREMGVWAFLSMQLILFGGLIAAFAHGPLAIALALSILTPIDLLGPIDLGLASAGYATALYLALAVAALLRDERIALAALTMPFYWPLASLAALRALGELFTRPHHWAKTEHGLAKRSLNGAISARTDAPRDKVAV